MDFTTLTATRQSTRAYDSTRPVESEKLTAILEIARLSPSACNGQPYHITVCRGNAAAKVARAVQGMGMNKFASDAPILLVISEKPYVATAALGAKAKDIDYRSIDMGILAAHITLAATEQGLGTCILGWLDSDKIKDICRVDGDVKMVITLGYPKEGDKIREKKRKDLSELVSEVE